jgi:cytoskeleton protein RodZ
MEDRGGRQGAFDERAALEELERLREEIDRRRAAREAAAGRFEAFIRSFQKPTAAVPVEPATATPATPQAQLPQPQGVAPPDIKVPPPRAGLPPPVKAPPPPVESSTPRAEASRPLDEIAPLGPATTSAPLEEPMPSPAEPTRPSTTPQKTRVSRRALVARVLLLPALGALGVWAWRQQPARVDVAAPGDAIQRSADPPSTRTSETPIDRPTAPPAGPMEPAPAATQLEIEITTTRGVWVRVLSDGERVLERELPAEARVPVAATQTIVIRAGDAGAVRVSVAGGDPQPLGPGGQPITRTFTREVR